MTHGDPPLGYPFGFGDPSPFVTDECRCPACVTLHPLQAINSDAILAADWKLNGPTRIRDLSVDRIQLIEAPPLAPDLPRRIVSVAGLAGCGKSTVANHLTERHGYARVRWAGPLKAMCVALGLTHDQVDGNSKEIPAAVLTRDNFPNLLARVDDAFAAIGIASNRNDAIPELCFCSYAFARDTFIEVLSWIIATPDGEPATPRRAMQMIGTEWGRKRIGEYVWTNLWQTSVDRLPAGVPVVVDDTRFPNETDTVRRLGGVLVRVVRPGAGSASGSGHVSEGQELPCDATLQNTLSVGVLLDQVDALVRDLTWAQAAAER